MTELVMGDTPSATTASQTWSAGWYDVPDRVNTRGYWDGERWTGDFVPKDETSAPTGRASSRNGFVVGLIGFVLLAVGSVGPWVDAGFISASGTRGDGKLTLAAAAIGALTLLARRGGAVFSALMGLAGLGVSVYDIVHVSAKVSQATFGGVQIAHVGWGLYVCAAGAVIAIIGSLIHRSLTPRKRAAA